MDEADAEIQSLTALLADEEPRVLQAIEDNRKLLATARGSLTRLKKGLTKHKGWGARETARARVFELEGPLREQEVLTEKRERLDALESNKARRIRAEEAVRAAEHNARVPTFLKLPRNVLDDILYSAMLQTHESEHSCLCWHNNNSDIWRKTWQKPWEVSVMRVCKALHDHVVASPAMWTFISMAVSGSSRAIETYISRSGCMKLHVSLQVCSLRNRMDRLRGYDPRFALLARNIDRIQVLCLLCDGYIPFNVATIPFHRLTAPSLVRLHLSFYDDGDYQLSQIDEYSYIPTSEDDNSSEFPLPDSKEAVAALMRGIVLVAEAPVLSTVSMDNGYFAEDLPCLAQVTTFCLTHSVPYVPDMELSDVAYVGNSDELRKSIQQLIVTRDAFGYEPADSDGEQEDDEEEEPHLPSLRSLFLLSPVRGTTHWVYTGESLPENNILHSITAPHLSNLGFFHDAEQKPDFPEDLNEWPGYPMSVLDLLSVPLYRPSRRPKFPQLKRLVAIHSGGLQMIRYYYRYGDEPAPPAKPGLKVLADTSQAVECQDAPFPDLEELMLVDDVRMGLIEGILGYKASPDNPEPCRYPRLTSLTLGVHRKPYLKVDLERLEKLLRARHDAGAPLTSVRFVGHAMPETEEEEVESQRICQRIRDLGVEDVHMHHGSAMLYMFLEEMFSEELVSHLKGLPQL